MNIKAMALASLLGLSAPAITEIAFSTTSVSAMPTDFPAPEGAFIDKSGQWVVKLNLEEFGAYTYEAQNRKTGNSLTLKKYTISGNKQRYTYTFTNSNYQYVIAYRPSDPTYIRLTVINPEGQTILNHLMERVGNDWDV